jgi:hypothetical protein
MHSVMVLPAAPVIGFAQSPLPTEFPPGSATVSADVLRQRASGKVFLVE